MNSSDQLVLLNLTYLLILKLSCFGIGFLIVRLGHSLMLAGAKGEFKFIGSLAGMKSDLATASPGLLYLLLGTTLIGYAMFVDKEIGRDQKPVRPELSLPAPNVALPQPPASSQSK